MISLSHFALVLGAIFIADMNENPIWDMIVVVIIIPISFFIFLSMLSAVIQRVNDIGFNIKWFLLFLIFCLLFGVYVSLSKVIVLTLLSFSVMALCLIPSCSSQEDSI